MAGSVQIDKQKLEAALSAMSRDAVMRGANKYRERIRREILDSGRVNTGEMMAKIEVVPLPPTRGSARAIVRPRAQHFLYQDQGTRAHGSTRPGGVLRFMPKGATSFVFAKRVRGVRAGWFMRKAALKMKAEDFA